MSKSNGLAQDQMSKSPSENISPFRRRNNCARSMQSVIAVACCGGNKLRFHSSDIDRLGSRRWCGNIIGWVGVGILILRWGGIETVAINQSFYLEGPARGFSSHDSARRQHRRREALTDLGIVLVRFAVNILLDIRAPLNNLLQYTASFPERILVGSFRWKLFVSPPSTTSVELSSQRTNT
jgi:hypothetical protein